MPPLIGPQQIATALRAVGLDDDAARLAAWADPARRERETAEQALADLAVAQTQLRTALGGLVSAATDVRSAMHTAWRGEAAGAYGEAVRRAATLAAELEREAGEWLALRATAERDAEDARRNAEARQRAAEETALAVLRSLAVAA